MASHITPKRKSRGGDAKRKNSYGKTGARACPETRIVEGKSLGRIRLPHLPQNKEADSD